MTFYRLAAIAVVLVGIDTVASMPGPPKLEKFPPLLNFESTRGAVETAVIRRRDGVAKLANIEGHTQLSRALIAP